MKLIIALMLLMSCVSATAYPSDLVQHQERPHTIDLQAVSPTSAQAMAELNEPLMPFKAWEMPRLGKLVAHGVLIKQDGIEGAPSAIIDFANNETL